MKLSKYNQFILKESIMSDNIEELISEIERNTKWKELDLSKEAIVALRAWRHPLSKKGFNCIIRLVEISKLSSVIFYLEDTENESFNFMDYVTDPMMSHYKRFMNQRYNKYTNFVIDSCEYQLDYFNNLEKFPNDENIKDCLIDFFDEEFELTSNINYGYKSNIRSPDNYSLTSFHRYILSEFVCAFILGRSSDMPKNEIDNLIKGFEFHLQYYGDFVVKYYYDERVLVIYFELN